MPDYLSSRIVFSFSIFKILSWRFPRIFQRSSISDFKVPQSHEFFANNSLDICKLLGSQIQLPIGIVKSKSKSQTKSQIQVLNISPKFKVQSPEERDWNWGWHYNPTGHHHHHHHPPLTFLTWNVNLVMGKDHPCHDLPWPSLTFHDLLWPFITL